MKIALFGATGETGTEVLKKALKNGYEVNLLVRDPSKITVNNPRIKMYKGDVNKSESFGDVLSNVDASIITLAGEVTEGVKNIINSMKICGVKKIILMSSYPMSGSVEGLNYLKSAGMDDEKIGAMVSMIQGKIDQEAMVTGSGLNWTIIRPTFLKELAKSGDYKVYTDNIQFDANKNYIDRVDVADFIIEVLKTTEWNNKIVSISS